MKILFVHPELRPGTQKDPRLQAAVAALRARGAVVLMSTGGSEALLYAGNLFTANKSGYSLDDKDIATVVVFRHYATKEDVICELCKVWALKRRLSGVLMRLKTSSKKSMVPDAR